MIKNNPLKYLFLGTAFFILPLQDIQSNLENKLSKPYAEIYQKFKINSEENVLIIDGQNQKMYLINGNPKIHILQNYDVSTGKLGFGNIRNSQKTPIGIHKIKYKYGENQPCGKILAKGMTSRIMRLTGCEDRNKNTYSRGIYIHGTAREDLIGIPASHGCIRMRNKDIIKLFKLVEPGTFINIKESIE